ncbi:MAG: acyl-CoA thioester hydrolase/BAAT C-terminal domain-containing protein [Bacteroidales bacterium]
MNRSHFLVLFLLFSIVSGTTAQNEITPDSRYYPARGQARNAVLLLLGGSEGGLPDYYDIEELTGLGYSCLVLGYFGTENTPDRLELIPLEYFEFHIDALMSRPENKGKKLIVWGGSKGGELVLLLGSKFPQIQGVIAVVPSSVVFQGLGGRPVSSWSENGQSIPFVPYAPYDFSKVVNSEYVEVYRLSLEQTDAVEQAAIAVEKINGPILLLAGQADTMWPSDQMCGMIASRLKEHNFPHGYQVCSYENAGHTLNDGYLMGGTEEGNRQARIDSKKQVLAFLDRVAGM